MESIGQRRHRRAERQPVKTGIDDRPAVVATSTGTPRRPAALRALTAVVVLAISAVLAACGTGTTGTGMTTTTPAPTRSTSPEATSTPVAAVSVVMIIRHGEKPGDSHPGIDANGNQDDSSLTAVGWDRAHRLVDLFDPAQGSPRPGWPARRRSMPPARTTTAKGSGPARP